MAYRVTSGWLYKPSQRNIAQNTFLVALEGVENEDDLPERVKRKLKKEFEAVLRSYNIYWKT